MNHMSSSSYFHSNEICRKQIVFVLLIRNKMIMNIHKKYNMKLVMVSKVNIQFINDSVIISLTFNLLYNW